MALFTAAGVVAAVATAATGIVDWTVSDDQDRRVGLLHGVLNTAALGLQGLSLTARLAGHRRTARGLGVTGLGVTIGAAYLGGHLVFARAVMVNRVAGADGPRRWVRVLDDADLPDDVPTGVVADGRQVLLYRHDGTLYALDNLCSHAAGLLSRGTVEGLTVTCPLHGSQYCLADGSVRRGPSHQPQPVIRTRIRGGGIEVRGNQPAPRRRANGRTVVMAYEIVANLDDLEPGETLLVEGLREPICLVMLDEDDVRAVHDTCTHQQQPLHEGTVQDDDTLVCASHNSRFDLTTGESVGIPVVPTLPVYACKIEGDAILVDIDQQLNDAPIPHRPYH